MPAIPGSGWCSGQRLYLFGREENRTAFAADPARFVKEADVALAAACSRPWRNRPRGSDAAAGSPQAMNSGTMKFAAPEPESQLGPL